MIYHFYVDIRTFDLGGEEIGVCVRGWGGHALI